MRSLMVFSGVRFSQSLVFVWYFVDRCLSLCHFFYGHCVVCSSSIYRIWLPFKLILSILNFFFENSNFTLSNICLLKKSLNHIVLYNDSYIEVFGSFTFTTLNCSLKPGERVFVYTIVYHGENKLHFDKVLHSHHDLLNRSAYLCHKGIGICIVCRNHKRATFS